MVVSGGGKELGGPAAIENQIKALSAELKVRIIGPNCIGMFNADNRLDCAFQGHDRMVRPKRGEVAFLSQRDCWDSVYGDFRCFWNEQDGLKQIGCR